MTDRFKLLTNHIPLNIRDNKTGELIRTRYRMCTVMNQLQQENEHMETIIVNMIHSERTDLGRMVLKQLADNLEIEYDV